MSPAGASPAPRRGPWSRPWVRRLTYLLASGAALTALASWVVRRDFVRDWALRELDRVVREETGLPLKIEDLELRLVAGRVVLHRVAWGGDLLQVKRLELVVDPLSLLGRRKRVHAVSIEGLRSVLDLRRLSALRFKPRPPNQEPLKVSLGEIRLDDGLIQVREPAWGLPKADFHFRIRAHGTGLNQVRSEVFLDQVRVGPGPDNPAGKGILDFDLSDAQIGVRRMDLAMGGSRVSAELRAGFDGQMLEGKVRSHLELAELARAFPLPGLQGSADLSVLAKGTLAQPNWELELDGRGLQSPDLPLQAGQLRVRAKGNREQARIAALDWESPEGRIHLQCGWEKGHGTKGNLLVENAELRGLSTWLHTEAIKDLRATFDGEFRLPGDPWNPVRMDRVDLVAKADFTRGEQPAGHLAFRLEQGALGLEEFTLRVPDLDLSARGSGLLSATGAESLQGEGSLRVDAAQVAKALKAWKLTDLDMGGRTEASGSVAWDRKQGMRVDGAGEILNPRWHGAQADRVRSEVRIRGSELWVGNTELTKGEGRAWGELRLDWGNLRPGADALDFCYRTFRLPVAEGLKAADLADLPIVGLGSAWVRIHGPFDRLLLQGEGLLEDGAAYGLRLPAGLASIEYDLASDRLRIPHFRLAESPAQLGLGEGSPEGLLALQGSLDLDLDRKTWQGRVAGLIDSTALALPGPRFQARIDGTLFGPWTRPFGSFEIPEGRIEVSQGRVFIGEQSVEGLKGFLLHEQSGLRAEVGSGQGAQPFALFQAFSRDGKIQGTLDVHVSAETADTANLAQRLTGDLLKDLRLDAQAEGELDAQGLRWQGRLHEFVGHFQGFDLTQAREGKLSGNAQAMAVDLDVEGRQQSSPQPGAPAAPNAPTATRLRLIGSLPMSATGSGNLRGVGSGQLADLKTILDHVLELENASGLLADLKPEGRATMDLTLSGSLENPRLDGTLALAAGRLMLRTFPQSVEDVSFTLQFKGREILLPESDPLMGTFAQGNLGVWGKATWQLGGLSHYDLRASLMDFLLRDVPAGFELQGSLDASLSGDDQNGGVLRGTLDAERAAYRTDISLNDLILNRSAGSIPDLAGLDPDDPLSRIDLDLDLNLRQPWDFDTNLLKIKGRPEGTFKILGTLARPGLKGRMEFLPGGRLTNLLPAGDVVLERCTIDFTDPLVMNPVIAMEGRIDIPPYLVTLTINGTLDQLTLVPTSTPSLRQDEVVAILIDPTLAQSIGTTAGPTSQTVLTSGFLGAGQSLLVSLAFANFQETLRKTLGLDRVNASVRTGTTGNLETSITLGKSFDLFNFRTPIIGTYRRSGEVATISGQVEWRFGNFVLQFGASGSNATGIDPTGEIRHTWSPR